MKTVMLVTHQVDFLPVFSSILVNNANFSVVSFEHLLYDFGRISPIPSAFKTLLVLDDLPAKCHISRNQW